MHHLGNLMMHWRLVTGRILSASLSVPTGS
jgi:hypothetical protein